MFSVVPRFYNLVISTSSVLYYHSFWFCIKLNLFSIYQIKFVERKYPHIYQISTCYCWLFFNSSCRVSSRCTWSSRCTKGKEYFSMVIQWSISWLQLVGDRVSHYDGSRDFSRTLNTCGCSNAKCWGIAHTLACQLPSRYPSAARGDHACSARPRAHDVYTELPIMRPRM